MTTQFPGETPWIDSVGRSDRDDARSVGGEMGSALCRHLTSESPRPWKKCWRSCGRLPEVKHGYPRGLEFMRVDEETLVS
jgi:hypothetical protein